MVRMVARSHAHVLRASRAPVRVARCVWRGACGGVQGELDFLAEAQAAMKVFASVSHNADGTRAAPAVGVPLPVQGLVSRRALVMRLEHAPPACTHGCVLMCMACAWHAHR